MHLFQFKVFQHRAIRLIHLFSIKRLCHLLFLASGSFLYLLGLLLHGFPGPHFSVSLTLLFPVKLAVCSLIAVLSFHMLQFCIEGDHVITAAAVIAVKDIFYLAATAHADARLSPGIPTERADHICFILRIFHPITFLAVFQFFNPQVGGNIHDRKRRSIFFILSFSFFHFTTTFLCEDGLLLKTGKKKEFSFLFPRNVGLCRFLFQIF